MTIRWTPGHRDLGQYTTTYHDYWQIQGNNEFNSLANMGNIRPVDIPPLGPHDIVLHGHIMPRLANSWIMQL